MTIQVIITCDNAAFGEFPDLEVGNILRRAADMVNRSSLPAVGDRLKLLDGNGNEVGRLTVISDND